MTSVRMTSHLDVEIALVQLGEGFLQHPANEALRRAQIAGALTRAHYFEELLRLVYRWIFLFAVEERALLHPRDDSPQAVAARQSYEDGYSARRLRERCLIRVASDPHEDLWQAQVAVFRALAVGEPRLALPALGGLFAPDQCAHLDAASLSNGALLGAMRALRWSGANGSVAPVDFRDMAAEELGSVYENLLELAPNPDPHARTFSFTRGNARKTSGSYYTPDSLVQELIESALDPVIDARLAAEPDRPTQALLGITVMDPACGSGYFLLAAARRLAQRLAALRAAEGAVSEEGYRHALREVITHCIYGVDRNPMAVELARFALWLEGFEAGGPLGSLDRHLVCGDALLGITDIAQLAQGIPEAAFRPLSGDDRAVCKAIARENREGLRALARLKTDPNPAQACDPLHAERSSRLKQAADLFVAAFLAPKAKPSAIEVTPTSQNLYLALHADTASHDPPQSNQAERLAYATRLTADARVLHWPLTFVHVFQSGGFDCVLGNPPWERIKLQEEEFFASENRLVALAKNKAERVRRIQWLSQGMLAKRLHPDIEHGPDATDEEKESYIRFIAARRAAEAASVFAHLKAEEGGRFPLTGVGDVNSYALFAETIDQIIRSRGRAGFIVPSGIATDDSTKRYFAHLVDACRLVSLFGFDNARRIFPAVHPDTPFALVTLGAGAGQAQLAHYILDIGELQDERRRFTLGPQDFHLINPNTLTCPVFRSRKDAELTSKIYARVPVLIRAARDGEPEVNPWGLRLSTMFHMSSDSHLFSDRPGADRLPLYEAKMIHQFDHRWATYRSEDRADIPQDVPLLDKQSAAFTVRPRYWVEAREVGLRTAALPKEMLSALRERNASSAHETLLERATPDFFLGVRGITNATNERTVMAALFPRAGAGNSLPLLNADSSIGAPLLAALNANLQCLCLDFVARQKIGGANFNFFIAKQLPVLPPDAYSGSDTAFIVPRVVELTYTALDLQPWAKALGYDGAPFPFDPDRRAQLRAELDAYYARLYGLSREDLCYILDPASVMGADYPSETFRVLKHNEEREFGEYRTQRLVLAAWDALERSVLHRSPTP